ncbi:MAG: O-antigen ligase family protein [Planctomycetota bacterium]|nr:O-antigen ligase family protein [Planctomycetota bacterium]
MPATPAPPVTPRESPAFARAVDPLGHRVHVAIAGAFTFVLPLGMVPGAKDVLLIVLFVYTLMRLPKISKCFGPLFQDPLAWWILAWPVWLAISLLWSPSPDFGGEELRAWRMLLVPLILWPVMQQFRLLIITFALGCGVVVLVQLGQVIGIPGFELDIQGRADAWMHPILAGAMLVSAAIWMLTGVLQWRGDRAAAMAAGLIVVVVGLVLTGSRGPWVSLAVAGTMLVIGTLVLCRTARRRTVTMGALGLVAIGGLILLDVYVLSGRLTGPIQSRIETALVETDSSAGDDHYEIELGGWHRTPVGYRLLVWQAARDVFFEHPVLGIGGGGLSAELDEAWWLSDPQAAAAGIPLSQQHLNPHSMYLQVLASTGLIGCLLLVIPMILAASRLLGRVGDPVFFGAAFVLVAWAAGAAFDAYQMMTAQVAVLMLVYAAAMMTRPVRRELAT